MKRLAIVAVLGLMLALSIGTSVALAAPGGAAQATIIGLDLDNSRSAITPSVVINTGIDRASRQGNAPFRLEFTFVYLSGGALTTFSPVVQVNETTPVGSFDANSDIVDVTFTLPSPVDNNTNITATVVTIAGR